MWFVDYSFAGIVFLYSQIISSRTCTVLFYLFLLINSGRIRFTVGPGIPSFFSNIARFTAGIVFNKLVNIKHWYSDR